MKVRPNPRFNLFFSALKNSRPLFTKWEGIAFRAASLEFARVAKLLNGQGSLKFGERWSAAGTFPAVNLSLNQRTAIEESGANFTYYNFNAKDFTPKVLVAVRLKLSRMINLAGALQREKDRFS